MKWKSFGTKQEIDLVSYIKQYLKDNPTAELMVGTDSQNRRKQTDYAIVVALHTNRGANLLYVKETFPRIMDRFTRLLKEVEFTIGIATELKESGINQKLIRLHFDLNPDPKFKSNDVVRTAMGWGEGLGYSCQCKPSAFSASYAADMLLK